MIPFESCLIEPVDFKEGVTEQRLSAVRHHGEDEQPTPLSMLHETGGGLAGPRILKRFEFDLFRRLFHVNNSNILIGFSNIKYQKSYCFSNKTEV